MHDKVTDWMTNYVTKFEHAGLWYRLIDLENRYVYSHNTNFSMMFSIVLLYFINRPFYHNQDLDGDLRMFNWINLARVDEIVL